jgi:hypothetical protein
MHQRSATLSARRIAPDRPAIRADPAGTQGQRVSLANDFRRGQAFTLELGSSDRPRPGPHDKGTTSWIRARTYSRERIALLCTASQCLLLLCTASVYSFVRCSR